MICAKVKHQMTERSEPRRAHLTDSVIRRLSPAEQGSLLIWDDEVKGFAIRITEANAKSFILNYRNRGGRQRRLTVGSFPAWSAAQAREEAKAVLRRVDQGADPLGDRQAERHAPTVADLAKRYIEDHLPKKRLSSQKLDRGYLNNVILPALGTRKVADIKHGDVVELHRKMKRPIAANRMLSLLSTMFGLAEKREWVTRNPCKGVERHREVPRQRYLDADEIRRLFASLDRHPGPSSNAIRLLLLTGARRSEVLSATWDQFNLTDGVWTKPHTSTKQRREHRVPLGEGALTILRQMRSDLDRRVAEAKGEGRILRQTHLFAGYGKPGQPRRYLDGTWATVTEEANIKGCRLHDLRHSFASLLASGGQSLLVIGQMLGHQSPSTTARYSHLFDETLKKAADAVSHAVTAARATPTKVVPLKR